MHITSNSFLQISRCNFSDCSTPILTKPSWLANVAPALVINGFHDLFEFDLGGGGAIYAAYPSLHLESCHFIRCSALNGQGGAMLMLAPNKGIVDGCSFVGCGSLGGGAISLHVRDRGQVAVFEVMNSIFNSNSATSISLSPQCVQDLCKLGTKTFVQGVGGAIRMDGCTLIISGGCFFDSNTAASHGGAIYSEIPSELSYIQILSPEGKDTTANITIQAPSPVDPPLNHYVAFLNNRAGGEGGAIALHNYPLYASESPTWASRPPTPDAASYLLFQNNSASIGGAISMRQSPEVLLFQVLFYGNIATLSSTIHDASIGGGETRGGAMSIVGGGGHNVRLRAAMMYSNTAVYGGGLSVSASTYCTDQQQVTGCFNVSIDASCDFRGNTAIEGAGGAIFWSHMGNLNITCDSDGGVMSNMSLVETSAIPCSSWSNNSVTGAGYGSIIASTAFYVAPVNRHVPYYTSNEPVQMDVIVQVSACNRAGCLIVRRIFKGKVYAVPCWSLSKVMQVVDIHDVHASTSLHLLIALQASMAIG